MHSRAQQSQRAETANAKAISTARARQGYTEQCTGLQASCPKGGGARAELELRKYQGEVSSSEAAFRQCIYLHLQIFALAVQCCAFAWPRKAKAKGTDSTDSTALESLQQF